MSMDRFLQDCLTAKTKHLDKLLQCQHQYMEYLLRLAEFQLERHREYYSITRFFLQTEEYGIKWLYCETPTTVEKIYAVNVYLRDMLQERRNSSLNRYLTDFKPGHVHNSIKRLEDRFDRFISDTTPLEVARHYLISYMHDGRIAPFDVNQLSSDDLINRIDEYNLYNDVLTEVKKIYFSETNLTDFEMNLNKARQILDKELSASAVLMPIVGIVAYNGHNKDQKHTTYTIYFEKPLFEDEIMYSERQRGMSRRGYKVELLDFIKNTTKLVSIGIQVYKEDFDINLLTLNGFQNIAALDVRVI